MKTANGNGNHNHSHARRAPSVVGEDAFEPLLTAQKQPHRAKIHPKTLQKMARNAEITAIQIGKLWRFRASALNEWLENIAS